MSTYTLSWGLRLDAKLYAEVGARAPADKCSLASLFKTRWRSVDSKVGTPWVTSDGGGSASSCWRHWVSPGGVYWGGRQHSSNVLFLSIAWGKLRGPQWFVFMPKALRIKCILAPWKDSRKTSVQYIYIYIYIYVYIYIYSYYYKTPSSPPKDIDKCTYA